VPLLCADRVHHFQRVVAPKRDAGPSYAGGVYLDIKSSARSLCKLIKPGDGLILSKWEDATGQINYLCSDKTEKVHYSKVTENLLGEMVCFVE